MLPIIVAALSITFSGIFLAVGFGIGRSLSAKVANFFSYQKGLESDSMLEFMNKYSPPNKRPPSYYIRRPDLMGGGGLRNGGGGSGNGTY